MALPVATGDRAGMDKVVLAVLLAVLALACTISISTILSLPSLKRTFTLSILM